MGAGWPFSTRALAEMVRR